MGTFDPDLSLAGNYKTAINDYIEEQKKELFEYVNSRVNNFSKLQLVLVQHEPFEKTPTQRLNVSSTITTISSKGLRLKQ